jgi:ATP/maltotriose-dependent transcriptional regulator MalT/DNA-binding SARP family transcriptional activator
MKNLSKITPPSVDNIWRRDDLLFKLNKSSDQKLNWISAPGGYGKTTLVADYIRTVESPYIWYRLDEMDVDAGSFFYYFKQAIKNSFPLARINLPAYDTDLISDLSAFSRLFFRSFFTSIDTALIVVFDDVHIINDCQWFLSLLLVAFDEAPDKIRFILMGRHRPPLELSSLVPKGLMQVITVQDLRLSKTETTDIAYYFSDKSLKAQTASSLFTLTDGWIGGVVLLAKQASVIGLEGINNDLAIKHGLFDFLSVEVFLRQTEDVKQFLMATAIFPKFTAQMAKELTANDDGNKILAELVSKNYFTNEYHGRPKQYDYHSLFREFLLKQCFDFFDETVVFNKRRQAAKILVEKGFPVESIEILVDIEDWDGVASSIPQIAKTLFKEGRSSILITWLEKLPEIYCQQQPWLAYWMAQSALSVTPKISCGYFDIALEFFINENDSDGVMLACAGVLESISLASDDFSQVEQWLRRYRELDETFGAKTSLETRAKATGSIVLTMCTGQVSVPWMEKTLRYADYAFHFIPLSTPRVLIGAYLGLYYGLMGEIGKLTSIVRHLRPALDSYNGPALHKVVGHAVLVLHDMITMQKDCEHTATLALDYGTKTGIHLFDDLIYGYLSYNHMMAGNLIAAKECIDKQRQAVSTDRRMFLGHYFFVMAWYDFVAGDLLTAKDQAEKTLLLSRDIGYSFGESITSFLLSNILVATGDIDNNEELLNKAKEIALATNSIILQYGNCCSTAWFLLSQGDRVKADKMLRKAFKIGRKNQLFAYGGWHRQMMMSLVEFALQQKIETEYTYSLIKAHRFEPSEDSVLIENWPWRVKVHCLGEFKLFVGDEFVSFNRKAQKRTLELLQCIVAEGAEKVSYETLIQYLWPEAEGDAAHSALESALYRLRKIIGKDLVQVKHGMVSLNRNYCWCDLWAAQAALDSLKRAQASSSTIAKDLEKLLVLYRGALLSDVQTPWVLPLRERLHTQILYEIERQAEVVEEPESLLLKGLEIDDLHEPFYLLLMQYFSRQSRNAQVVSTYQRCERLLRAELGVAPSEETSALVNQSLLSV